MDIDNTASTTSTSTTTNIEDVQDKVDRLVLTVFEAVIGHKALALKDTTTTIDPTIPTTDNNNINNDLIQHHSKCIIDIYKDTINSINNLSGINKTKAQQEEELLLLSQQYTTTKNNVIILENNVKLLHSNINNELVSLLDDQCISLKPPPSSS